MPKVSVVIPLYNKEHCIGRTLRSVLAQSCADLEVVVVNDGSTDGSLRVVEVIHDERLRVIDKPNEGVSATRNRGMKEALGEYVFLLDADDLVSPNALEVLMDLERDFPNCDIYTASFLEKDENGNIVKRCVNGRRGISEEPFKEEWNGTLFLRFGNMFFRRTLLQQVGGIREDLTLYEDKEWLMRMFAYGVKVCMSPTVILDYVRTSSGLSHNHVPIVHDFAGEVRLSHASTKYERKLLADFLARRIIRRLLARDVCAFITMVKHNLGYLIYSFVIMLQRRILFGANN